MFLFFVKFNQIEFEMEFLCFLDTNLPPAEISHINKVFFSVWAIQIIRSTFWAFSYPVHGILFSKLLFSSPTYANSLKFEID